MRLVLVDCPVCGHDNRALAKFCDACGQPLEPGVAVGQPDPRSYTPAHLAEKMRRHRPSEGERRTVTILFVDAVGSTPLAEKLGEEEMYSLMREALSRMTKAVHRYEGHVAAFTGDGLMALFGAPIAHEDSARRAVAAALGMQSSLVEYGSEIERRHGVECRFRVGVNTGPAVVGTVTDDLRMDFTAIGDTVNLAARMEQVAEPGGVLVSQDTHKAIADFFECEAVGELAVKGKARPVGAWRVIREKEVRTRFQAAAERGLSPLVGRARELEILAEHVERAGGGTGQVVFVSGPAGIGKSRLIVELRRRVEGVRWLEGQCVSYGRSSPYLPVVDLLKGLFGVAEGDDDARIIARVDEVALGWEAHVQKRAPYLKYLLSVDPGDEAVVSMDPQERRVEIFGALGALLVEESRRRPLVVAVEDLHWADRLSVEALGSLMMVVPTAPVLLLLTHRPEYEPPKQASALELGHLDEEQSIALTRGVLGAEALPPEIHELVTAKAEGNPFYIEELSKSFVEAGVLERVEGTYRLQGTIDQVRVPGTIEEVILSRLDRLDREAREAMQLASVVGREFTARVLDRISDLELQLSEVLGDLTALELIYETARFPELTYMFKHALIHDVAYATLLGDRRRAMHRRVGAAVEELYGDRLAEHHETLAYHFSEGQDWEKALEYLEKAGDKAAAAYANREALVFFDRALEVAARLDDGRAEAAVAERKWLIDLTVVDLPAALADTERMGQAGRRLGDRRVEARALARRGRVELVGHEFEAAEASFQAALAVGGEYDDVRFLATFGLYHHHATLFGPVAAEPYERALREMAPTVDDRPTVAMWTYLAMLMERMAGRYAQVLERARQWREMTGNSDAESQALAQVLWAEALTLTEKGDYEQALSSFLRVDAMTERMGDAFRRGRVLNSIGWLYNEVGNHDEALSWNVRAAEFAEAYPAADAEMESNARLNLGDTLMALGRLDEAGAHYAWVERVVREHTPKERWILWRYSQHLLHSCGELWLKRSQPRRALGYADECLSRAEATGAPRYVVKARRLRGQALLALDDLEEAERELLLALDVAGQLGNPPELWKTHAGIGDLRRAQGRIDDAREAYREALWVIEEVAGSLTDAKLRDTFLESEHVQDIRRAAEARS